MRHQQAWNPLRLQSISVLFFLFLGCPTAPGEVPSPDAGVAIPCGINEHVQAGSCLNCPPGTQREAGDNEAGADTTCDPIRCPEDHHVQNHDCVACGPGTQRAAGDDASGEDSQCDPVTCAEHQWVEAHQCRPCPQGSGNGPGDDASGPDTVCDPCAPGTYDSGDHRCVSCPPGAVSEAGATDCTPCAAGTFGRDNSCEACGEHMISREGASSCQVEPVLSRLDPLDYGYTYWPGNHWYNWGSYETTRHIMTGFYGLAFDVSTANLVHMGSLAATESTDVALLADNGLIEALPAAALHFTVRAAGQYHVANGFWGRDRSPTNPSELIDMGRFMQRIEIPEVTYENTEMMEGRVQLAAMPKHFVLTHRARTQLGGIDLAVRIEIGGEALADFPETQWLEEPRALSIRDADGRGWNFILPTDQPGIGQLERTPEGGVVAERYFAEAQIGDEQVLSLQVVPAQAALGSQGDLWLNPTRVVSVESNQLRRDGSNANPPSALGWDAERGAFLMPIRNLTQGGAPGGRPYGDPDFHNWYNRHRVVFTNHGDEAVSIPLAMDGGGNAAVYITGGSPLWRDVNGEPVGLPIQISKNWHDPPAWYHLYSSLTLPPGQHEFELTFVHSKWGEAYTAAHAQLSLVGWGRNQQWDQSSLGSFGESITYDPDLTLGRSMVDDVRPFLVDANGRWNWTGNVGGANFLVYANEDTDNRPEHQLGRLRTHYGATGPNLTDVIYGGVTRDGKIEARIATQLGRTDDLVRVYYHLDYLFLEDVTYDRLALFQMAADRYGDNGFTRYAYGNQDEVRFDEPVPEHGATGYASDGDRAIPLTGIAPWVMLYANTWSDGNLPENLANVGFVVRDYRAQIGDEVHTTPHINIIRTNNRSSQMAFELAIPEGDRGRSIPAGSQITATVEYLVPPADKARYYGGADYLTAMPPESYENTDMLQTLASENRIEVSPSVGNLRRRQPVELQAVEGALAVQFTMGGGIGYTPVTIDGLARPDGWRLQRRRNDEWRRVDQSVEGNDYWQALDRGGQGYALVFNIRNRGANEYRLVR